ncbi:hypothetical protein PHYBLDRAFT_177452 [Phycomyces blakesleeanus NRRL 1555(-)]|uniref:Phospholipid-transporting ATPase n=1 Tax=Phycomyces blakesleeanus (strain ATCC 8743b / DSM 1359 / FGSC 10004 / NBRC 33097 / NRRL 1555) TaxID=763407 RepID=A0A162XE77_PHYB8|nr:hypothetical protein PHYBLDRAFT_177452 [Phycomyces blakesleeanus NRRL 1555(-)]OAD74275.1 hypothetical protein PHYBLDRAFT_177452 [Phycomyces blakesleeanus NRRL 1555(-)]|eukprot:XP_018292315.1 hypothetical protein PHYBLDRAFT_177452 [Phycomyces blakesleeanus NRRL 1555(-)]
MSLLRSIQEWRETLWKKQPKKKPRGKDEHYEEVIRYTTNRIRTSKYTILSFVPKNLFEQFRRAANIYFLGMAILQMLPTFGVKSPALTLLPICTVVVITALKDAFEDLERHKVDARYNSTPTHTLLGYNNTNHPQPVEKNKNKINAQESSFSHTTARGVFEPSLSRDVRVGDFILLRNGESLPADAVLLASAGASNICFVETKDLDGETNLKPRQGIEEYSSLQSGQACLDNCHFYLESGPPNPDLYAFEGTLVMLTKTLESWSETKKIPISTDNLLLRGHVIRNTPWVIAVVLFTGTDTKIMLNSGETPSKRSQIERQMNKEIILAFVVLFILSFVCAAMGGVMKLQDDKSGATSLYSRQTGSAAYVGFENFWASLIIFQNIIPISLYVSIEFVKTFQAYFIWNDREMWDESTGQPCIPKSWNLSDDLGQIEYVFSDKTGTLTQNVMEFRECSVGGRRYGNNGFQPESEGARGARLRLDPESTAPERPPELFDDYLQSMKTIFEPRYATQDPELLSFADPALFKDLEPSLDSRQPLVDFFTLLAICHTVVRKNDPKDSPIQVPAAAAIRETLREQGRKIQANFGIKKKAGQGKAFAALPLTKVDQTVETQLMYKAESPDEAALVTAARNCGFAFVGRQGNRATLDVLGESYEYEVIRVLAFTSTRKRMSVVVRRPAPWNDVVLYCKGADNVIIARLAPGQEEYSQQTQEDLDSFSNDGLRTLVLGWRVLDPKYFETWNESMEKAMTSTENRSEKVDQLQEEIEQDLILLGATGIEDKLQEGVPETIEDLRHAGMKIWVLTGDKLETAINIGYASNLLTKDMHIWTLRVEDVDSLDNLAAKLVPTDNLEDGEQEENALVLEGSALAKLFETDETRDKLLQVALLCKSVVCCRVSPLQKALVVEMVRKGRNAVTLAVGDGANDVSMIQAANVGVGIAGKEGVQASMASDYSIGQFRFLGQLLLVQGHWSYGRIAEMVLNFFFKNVFWVFPSLWYQIYSRFSGNIFYDYSFLQLYNIIFTLAPVIIMGCTDQDITAPCLRKYPQTYEVGIHRELYTKTRFCLYFLDGIWQSLVVFYCFFFLYEPHPSDHGSASMLQLSTGVAVSAIVLANLVPGFNTYYWTWIMFLGVGAELVINFAWIAVYGSFSSTTMYGIAPMLYSRGSFWLTGLLSVVFALIPRYTISFVRQWWYSDVISTVRQREYWERRSLKKSA